MVAGRVDVLTDTQAIELDWLKGNKFHEGIGQALHYGDVTGQQPVLALISAYLQYFRRRTAEARIRFRAMRGARRRGMGDNNKTAVMKTSKIKTVLSVEFSFLSCSRGIRRLLVCQ